MTRDLKVNNGSRVKSGMSAGLSWVAVGHCGLKLRLHADGWLTQITNVSRANTSWPRHNTKSIGSHIEPAMAEKSLTSASIRAHRAYGIDSSRNQRAVRAPTLSWSGYIFKVYLT